MGGIIASKPALPTREERIKSRNEQESLYDIETFVKMMLERCTRSEIVYMISRTTKARDAYQAFLLGKDIYSTIYTNRHI